MAFDYIDLEDRTPELQAIRELGADEWLKSRSQRNQKRKYSGKNIEADYCPIIPVRDLD